MFLQVRRERVGERPHEGLVGRFVRVGRVVGVKQGVRLLYRNLDRDHVAGCRRAVGRNAVLAQPVVHSFSRLGFGSNELLDLRETSRYFQVLW